MRNLELFADSDGDLRSAREARSVREEAATATLLRIAQRPRIGPRCSFTADELRGTRRMPVAGFAKHLIFYQSSERKILVLRVVHGARDLESLFSE